MIYRVGRHVLPRFTTVLPQDSISVDAIFTVLPILPFCGRERKKEYIIIFSTVTSTPLLDMVKLVKLYDNNNKIIN